MTQIIGYTELLAEQAEEAGQGRLLPDLCRIRAAATHWLGLVEDNLLAPSWEPRGEDAPTTPGGAGPAPLTGTTTGVTEVLLAAAKEPDSGSLLVVDDDPANREMLARRLRRCGYEVRLAESGLQALEAIAAGPPDLLLLDFLMPGIDGLEVLARLRRQHAPGDLPVIMVTGKDSSLDVVQALRLGANDYITKPIDFAPALARIRTHLKLKGAQAELRARTEQIRRLAKDLELRNRFIQDVFGRYVTEEVVQSLLETPRGLELGGQKRVVTMIMSDLRGFTALAERLSPEKVVELLNVYLGAMADVISRYGGIIDEFIGDAILAVFGAPLERADHAEQALACALAMQLAMEPVNAELTRRNIPTLEMGIGIHTGEVIVGNIGSTRRAKFGVIGSHVNLTARIESATVGRQILASHALVRAVGSCVRIAREFTLSPKGVKEPLRVFEVSGLAEPHNLFLPEQSENLLDLPSPLPVQCLLVDEHKQVAGAPWPALLLRLSLNAACLHSSAPIAQGAAVKLLLPGDPAAAEDTSLYAKVLETTAADGTCALRFTAVPPAATAIIDRLRTRVGPG
ncbi:MAG: adenylate/guanylate cyclase domain-containing response regulator [Verrucomicrobia bacterium]|nr:adenylate/guanylate cyclase domain-containing response regulator [Verrucomicrobiota bacterium]